jgi:DinB superfamily
MTEDFETLREELERVLGGLDEHQTQLKPAGNPAKWSIQQIVGHLLLTYGATGLAMDARLAKGAATKAKPSIAQKAGQFGVITMGYVPRGRAAPEAVTCASGAPKAPGGMLIAQAETAIRRMDRQISAVEKMFGPACRAVNHMLLGPLSARQWRRFHLVHGRHHIKQIAAIRREYNV